MEIKGNTAMVTGGASGLGEAVARMVAATGGNVVIMAWTSRTRKVSPSRKNWEPEERSSLFTRGEDL